MERDSFTFRKSWTKALRNLPVEVRVEVLSAVLTYTDTGETVEMGDMARAAFLFIKTDIDVEVEARAELSRKRAEAVRRRWERRTAAATGGTGDAERAGDTSDTNDTNNTSDTKHTNDTSNTSDTNVSFVSSAASEKERTKERTKERETNTDDVEVECNPGKKQPSSPEKEKEKAVYKYTEKESEKEPPKSRKVFRPPTLEEVCGFAVETGASHADPEEFHDFYTSKGWKVGREPMKDWRAAFRRWEREHRKRDEAEERRFNEKIIRTGNGNRGQQKSGPIWSPTDDQRAHPEKYYQTTF